MADLSLTRALTNFPRSWHAIATAIKRSSSIQLEPTDRAPDVAHTAKLVRELRHMNDAVGIDAHAVRMAFYGIVGFMAELTGETPRTILEQEFALAPTDDDWRQRLGGGDEREAEAAE